MKAKSRRRIKSVWDHLILIIVIILLFFPVFWMISTAFKTRGDAVSVPPSWIPPSVTGENFRKLFDVRAAFPTYIKNTLIVCTITAGVCIICSSLTGYGLSRLRFRGRRLTLILILASQMFPLSLMLIPIYILFRHLQLLNSYLGLVLAFTSFGLPFSVWMMKGFYDTIPVEIEESALIDGCGPFRMLYQIVFPLVAPGVVTVGFYAFLQGWNNLLFPLTLNSRMEMRTIAPGFILSYVGEYEYFWTEMMAGSCVATLPIVLIFIFLQKYYIAGLTKGAVKG
jgi:multiple sugar transport system permease protein